MHVAVCIKQVPDTAEVKIDPETNTLVRAGIESMANPYDMTALEEALRLKDKYGAKVTALSMGPPQADSVLRQALSMGADDAVLLSDRAFAGADTLATSYTLSKAIETLGLAQPVDLVLCGKQAIDGDTAQTGPGIAERLGLTQFTYVIDVESIDPDTRRVRVRRKVDGGFEVISGRLPALLSVELELATPRRASLPMLIDSFRAPIKIWDAKAINASLDLVGLKGSPTWVKAIASPQVHRAGPKWDAAQGLSQAVSAAMDTLFSDENFAAAFQKGWKP
ncbi:MAG: electron transfer flavoprotein subunit beta/FixA family protein [Syntrophobacteraceae bacterium]|nr:electron transfer flavoprotein subunit beta/FixA family protein [Syntrophobacteraceae bacterium]